MEYIKKNNNEKNNVNLDNIRVMALKEKKIDAIIIVATKLVIKKLLIALINMVYGFKKRETRWAKYKCKKNINLDKN